MLPKTAKPLQEAAMFEPLEKQTRLTGNQRRLLVVAVETGSRSVTAGRTCSERNQDRIPPRPQQ